MKCGTLLVCIAVITLTACSYHHHDVTLNHESLFDDALFTDSATQQIESVEQIFALTREMSAHLTLMLATHPDRKDRIQALVTELFDDPSVNLTYKNSANLVAGDTFAIRKANCLSMSILAYVMADSLGLKPKFQEVNVPEFWVRRDGYSLLNGHINVGIDEYDTLHDTSAYSSRERRYSVDFDPGISAQLFSYQVVSKARVAAMFYNNKAAELLTQHQFASAYAYVKAAIRIDPYFVPALSNLGVLYRLRGDYPRAFAVYQAALSIDPANSNVLENLAVYYDVTGDKTSAQTIEHKIRTKRLNNPYYHFLLGEESLANQQYDSAIRHYRQALDLNRHFHGFYFGMAKAYFLKGDTEQSKLWLERARNKAPGNDLESLYQRKLNLLSRL